MYRSYSGYLPRLSSPLSSPLSHIYYILYFIFYILYKNEIVINMDVKITVSESDIIMPDEVFCYLLKKLFSIMFII